MARLYTRTGDDGTTGLFGGGRVGKDHPRVEAYGAVDELNAAFGLAAAACDESRDVHRRFLAVFREVQSRLFDLGADLATPAPAPGGSKQHAGVRRISERDVAEAERWIDEVDAGNEPMRHFVLPGGCELSARLHVARTICRRAERRMVSLARMEHVTPEAIIYVNRISDLLFAMARRANRDAGVADVPWNAG
jgi:cob(I)alamin adenosyltransferase